MDLGNYSVGAESFLEEIDREYYLHGAGHKPELEIEPIYERHAELFSRESLERLREHNAGPEGHDESRELLRFAFDGYLGEATKAATAELARLESSLEIEDPEAEGGTIPYRAVSVEQANEPDPARRSRLGDARDELLGEQLNPLYLECLDRSHELARELGWPSYLDACAELRGLDLEALAAGLQEFRLATAAAYEPIVGAQIEDRLGIGLGELTRSDLPRFFRAADLDAPYAGDRLVASFAETMTGLGIDLDSQDNVHLDTEARPLKSPRAFCATPQVPGEVYLVVQPIGGREDFSALFHEGGHTEHFAHTDATLPLAARLLGDNSVTESFAFLFEHLTEDPEWLGGVLGIAEPEPIVAQARAVKLLMLRRYCAKIAYEVELHGAEANREAMPERYAGLLEEATKVRWPAVAWLSDVDPGFYVACYLRAWALETHWRRALRERFGPRWFESAQAGAWLRELWSQGQRLDAEELLAEHTGEQLDFGALAAEFDRG